VWISSLQKCDDDEMRLIVMQSNGYRTSLKNKCKMINELPTFVVHRRHYVSYHWQLWSVNGFQAVGYHRYAAVKLSISENYVTVS